MVALSFGMGIAVLAVSVNIAIRNRDDLPSLAMHSLEVRDSRSEHTPESRPSTA